MISYCPVCNKETVTKFCSPACKQKDWRRRHSNVTRKAENVTQDTENVTPVTLTSTPTIPSVTETVTPIKLTGPVIHAPVHDSIREADNGDDKGDTSPVTQIEPLEPDDAVVAYVSKKVG